MTDRDSIQTTWERPCGGRNYAQRKFFYWLDKLEKDLHDATVSDKLTNISDKDSE
jgi:hypothetical protein